MAPGLPHCPTQGNRTLPSCCAPQASICTEVIRRLLQQHGPAITVAAAAVAELDCLCSFAAAARELGYCRPQLVQESVIHIEGGEACRPQPAGGGKGAWGRTNLTLAGNHSQHKGVGQGRLTSGSGG